MKALTIWQPWASLIIVGAKPYEFRRWSYAARFPKLVGQRIVIHAGARPIKAAELLDIRGRLNEGNSSLVEELARPLIDRLLDAAKGSHILPLACSLGTALLNAPIRATDLFKDYVPTNDSDRIDEAVWAWPLAEIQAFDAPHPSRGFQGFWDASEAAA